MGDSVRCVIQRIDQENNRIIVTLKPALVPASTGSSCFFLSFMREAFSVSKQANKSMIDPSIFSKSYHIGAVVSATVTATKDFGVKLLATDRSTVMLAQTQFTTNAAIGAEVKVRILDIDFETNAVEVSMLAQHTTLITKTAALKVGDIVTGVTLLVKDKYLVVLSSCGIGYVMIADFHCPYQSTDSQFPVGGKLSLRLVAKPLTKSITFPHESAHVFTIHDESAHTRTEMDRLVVDYITYWF